MVLVKNSRLSVQPVTPEQWKHGLRDGRRQELTAPTTPQSRPAAAVWV